MNVVEVLPRDAIPSIDDPTFGDVYFGEDDDEVLVLPDAAPPRAYPLRILGGHEVVNDRLDGRAVAVTFCPICWSTVVFDRRVRDRTLTFGVSGKLADDALVLYDRETASEWRQVTGECIAGEYEGERLTTIDAPVTTFETFRETYPDGVVLQPVRGDPEASDAAREEVYDMAGYERYRRGDHFGLYGMRGTGEVRAWDREDLDAKTVVYGVELGGEARGYPLPLVQEAGGVVTDQLGETDLLVVAEGDRVATYVDPGHPFELRDGTLHGDGTRWDPVTGASGDGRSLERVAGVRQFAFAWQDSHGPGSFYEP